MGITDGAGWHALDRCGAFSSLISSDTLNPDEEDWSVASRTQDKGLMLKLSASVDMDVLRIDMGEFEDLPLHAPMCEEHVEIR